jgi:hypothetical protein
VTTGEAVALGMIGLHAMHDQIRTNPEFIEKVYGPAASKLLKQSGIELSEDLDSETGFNTIAHALNRLASAYQEFEAFELENGDEQWQLDLADYSLE